MGRWVILCIPLFLALLVIIPNANGEAYWGNLKVDIEKADRIPGEKTDIIRVRAEFTNNDREEITIYYMYVVLDDSKHRQFSHSDYYDLRDKGHDIKESYCPFEFQIELNPGISEEGNFCFEVPKENVEFTFHIYESSIDWCKAPSYGSCQEKTIRLNVPPPAPPREESKTSSSSGGGIVTFDTTPPVILSPSDIVIDAEDSSGAFVEFEVLAIDDVDQIVKSSCTPSSGSFFSIGDTKVVCSAFDSAGNSASKKSFLVTVNTPSTSIPSWIKDVAAFWCENKIDDASFVEGIQYLIDNDIIVISGTTTGTGSQEIPSWVKNNACWWSQGFISDADFAQGLQYLVREGIIRV